MKTEEDTQDLEIKALGKIAEKFPEVILNKELGRGSSSKRGISIQFSMCHFHDIALIS